MHIYTHTYTQYLSVNTQNMLFAIMGLIDLVLPPQSSVSGPVFVRVEATTVGAPGGSSWKEFQALHTSEEETPQSIPCASPDYRPILKEYKIPMLYNWPLTYQLP